jgi:hypothetical protein
MGTEPPADKKKPPAAAEQRETQTEDRGSRTKGYRGSYKRDGGKSKSNGNKEAIVSKTKFKGAINALQDYYFDTGPSVSKSVVY